MTFEEIKSKNTQELGQINGIIRSSLESGSGLLNEVVETYLRIKGKQVRPLMVVLSARMFGEPNEKVYLAGAALEILHNASLIHDDVVDETHLRRGLPTINARWDNRIAVLVGDFFVSQALAVGISTGNLGIISAISELGKELSIGEIDQISNVREHNFSQKGYFEMIGKKTASLFEACVKMGAEALDVDVSRYGDLLKFAEIVGLCFQIKDDIFDYCHNSKIGKPTGNDLREGKVTLPLLYALEKGGDDENAQIRRIVEKPEISEAEIEMCISYSHRQGGVDYAYECMERLRARALESLYRYPASEARSELEAFLDYIIARAK